MKIGIDTDTLVIKLLVDNTDAREVLAALDNFDSEEWDEYDIVIDGLKYLVNVFPQE